MERKEVFKCKVKELFSEAKKRGLSLHEIQHAVKVTSDTSVKRCGTVLGSREGTSRSSQSMYCGNGVFLLVVYVLTLLSAILLHGAFHKEEKPRCLFNHSDYTREIVRPVVVCDFCQDLFSVPVVENIDQETFIRDYAYTSRPVLVKGATKNWTAITLFNYQLIKDLFFKTGGPQYSTDCEFLTYATDYSNLTDFFSKMPDNAGDREVVKPWYIGWHLCWEEIRREILNYYQRPEFLPPGFDSSLYDYIFMGVTGKGAVLHLDLVQQPTWQAQVTGTKTWKLLPPTECERECRPLNVTVNKGDIIILETSLWFHSTHVHPGEISIAIGKEYD